MNHRDRDDHAIFLIVYSILILAALLILSTRVQADTLESKIRSSAIKHGVNPELALSIAEVESQFDESKVGSLGEIGIFQMRPEFHPVVRYDVQHNIDLAMTYLAKLKRQCSSYGDAFFVCYNYGTARKLKRPTLFPYYRKVKLAQKRRMETDVASRD